MTWSLRRIVLASGFFTGGTLLSGAITFGLLAVFTRFLTPADFGILALLTATHGVLGTIVGLNPHLFFTAKYSTLETADLRRYGGSVLWVTGVMVAAAYGVLELLSRSFEAFGLPHWVLAGLAVLAGASAVLGYGLTLLKMRERSKSYAAVEVLHSAVAGGISVFLVVVLSLGWRGKFLGEVIAGFLAAVAMATYLVRTRRLAFDTSRRKLREYVGFSLPLVPHSLGYWAINAQDRYFVFAMSGAEAAGLYSIGYLMGKILEVVTQGALKAFSPFFYRNLQEETRSEDVVLLTYGFLALVAVAGGLMILVLEIAIPVFLGPDFKASAEFVPWIVAGYAFNAARNFMAGFLYVEERTRLLAAITVAAAILNAALNFILISWVGAIGAAVATAVTFLAVAIATSWFAVRAHAMPWKAALARIGNRQ